MTTETTPRRSTPPRAAGRTTARSPQAPGGAPGRTVVVTATPPPAPEPGPEPPTPPALIYVPGMGHGEANTSRRVAQILARTAGDTAGPWHVDELARSQTSLLSDAHRIMVDGTASGTGGRPVLDVFTYDYRPRLTADLHPHGTGVAGALRQVVITSWYFLRVSLTVLGALRSYARRPRGTRTEAPGTSSPAVPSHGRRAPSPATLRSAKGAVAKLQLLLGLAAMGVLFASLALAVVAAAAAFGVVTLPDHLPDLSGTLTALSATAGATWLWTWFWLRGRPVVLDTARKIQAVLDYAEDERFAAGVAGGLATAIDELLDAHPARRVHLLGYSLGALVAMDFVFPRERALPHLDRRHRQIDSITTVGSPGDFVLQFFPGYVDGRLARNPRIRWDNVFNASDVFGSNFLARDDVARDRTEAMAHRSAGPAGTGDPVCITVAGLAPVNFRFTSATLRLRDIWVGRGFTRHVEYWSGVDDGHCLNPLVDRLLVRSAAVR